MSQQNNIQFKPAQPLKGVNSENKKLTEKCDD